ncbi:MAG: hypothetical protein HYX20_02185 [Candidatus Yanofskybacteria bacterium]|nr:hypothetical protein [Candidatus Yanofskybacteria bacterium]
MSQFGRFLRFWSPVHEPMSIRTSLFRFGIFFLLVFLIILLPFLEAANAQEILPFNQIKRGDMGYGLTVFRGEEPERFNFKVSGILDFGFAKYFVVTLSGGPTDENGVEIIKDGNVFGGMSGSPLYIDDKIIGALAITGQFLKKPQALVTPIELMVNFRTTALDSLNNFLDSLPNAGFFRKGFAMPHNVRQLKAGESYMACEVWDDNSDFCIGPGGTVTLVDSKNSGIFYSLGHSGLSQSGIVSVPFWKAEVITTMPSFALSQKLLKKTGPMLGTVIFNSPFGQVAKFGVTPPFIPLTISIENNFRGTLTREYLFAYTPNMGTNISRTLSGTERLIDNVLDTEAQVRIDISGLTQIYFAGSSEELSAVGDLIDTFSKSAVISNIKNIAVILSARPKYEILEFKKAEIESITENKNGLDLKINLLAGNGEFFTNTFNITVDKKYLGKKLGIANGGEIASKILSGLGSNGSTVNLLNSVSDRNALYLYFMDGEDIPKPDKLTALVISLGSGYGSDPDTPLLTKIAPTLDGNKTPAVISNKEGMEKMDSNNLTDGWKAQPTKAPIIEILSKINLPSKNYLIKGNKYLVLTLMPPQTESQQTQQKKKRKFWPF